MKRRICFLLIIICLTIISTGCGTPKGISDNYYDVGCKVLDITDDYLDLKIERDEAQSDIASLASRLEKSGNENSDSLIGYWCNALANDLDTTSSIEYTDKDILEDRNCLAQVLKQPSKAIDGITTDDDFEY